MKPRTELQKKALALSKKLPPVTEKQREWAIGNIFKPAGYLWKRNRVWCSECGHEWVDGVDGEVTKYTYCPACDQRLKTEILKAGKNEDRWYYTIYDKSGGFQVLRHFVAIRSCRVGQLPLYEVNECVQNWISPDGKIVNIARKTQMAGYCYDLWIYSSEMEVRGEPRVEAKFNIHSKYIYPSKRFIPELRRNGFTGALHGFPPRVIMSALLSNPKAETLLKAKQINLFKWCLKFPGQIAEHWDSIKICLRNNYKVKDASIYLDYISLLKYFGKDVRNAKYVCPKNMRREHDRLSDKKHEIESWKREEKQRIEALQEEEKFKEMKGHFFGIAFTDGEITVKVLESIDEYIREGEIMSHCVFSNEYFKEENTLVLTSIGPDGSRLETIEISLDDFRIIQCRGKRNKSTRYHKRIMKLVDNNVHLIKQRVKQAS